MPCQLLYTTFCGFQDETQWSGARARGSLSATSGELYMVPELRVTDKRTSRNPKTADMQTTALDDMIPSANPVVDGAPGQAPGPRFG